MMLHQDFTAAQATAHRERLIAEADRRRLLVAARRGRAARAAQAAQRAAAASTAVTNATTSADTGATPAARGAPAGTLAACGPRVAAPVR